VWALTAEVIREWDPYRLLGIGAPTDEFDHEISSLVAQLPRIRSSADAIHAISRIFSSSFEPDRFRPEDCREVGNKLFARLIEGNFVSQKT